MQLEDALVNLVSTDLFRFMAVRPVQLVSDGLDNFIIRDVRLKDEIGVQHVRQLAQDMSPTVALERWRKQDTTKLTFLANRLNSTRRVVQNIADGDTVKLEELDASARLRVSESDFALAWDALYVADATGADAGPRLEAPLAALQVLTFAERLENAGHLNKQQALDALSVVPAISPIFRDSLPSLGPTAPVPEATTAAASRDGMGERLKFLARDIESAERMLDLITNSPSTGSPRLIRAQSTQSGSWSRSVTSVSSAPALRDLFGSRLNSHDTDLLDRMAISTDAPVPAAAQALQQRLTSLTNAAAPFSADSRFTQALAEARHISDPGFVGIGSLTPIGQLIVNETPNTAPDADVRGLIRPLGIGDLKVVRETLLAYEAGEVAHIENVLQGESKERTHRRLDRTETTLFTSEESSSERERDTQSTDRFELKRETEQTIKDDLSIKAGLNVTAAFGPVVTTATGDFAYSNSKTDSSKGSSNFARELVDRSISKVVTKVRSERTTKTIAEIEEINKHSLDNSQPGGSNINGVYRWVDKRYRAQIYNYGRRLLLEFVLPEPAAFFRAAQKRDRSDKVGAVPPADLINERGHPLSSDDINETNYTRYAARYQVAGVSPPPPLFEFVGTSLVKDGVELGKTVSLSNKELTVPDGYTLQYYSATVTAMWLNGGKLTLQVGRDLYTLLDQNFPNAAAQMAQTIGRPEEVFPISGSVPVSIATYDVTGFAVNIQGQCIRTTQKLGEWQQQTYDKIVGAYQALKTAYDQKVAQAASADGITIEGRNPETNRIIEKTELKKLCITMMTGEHFSRYHAMTDPPDKPIKHPEVDVLEALAEGRIIQFFEQIFEWEQMTYLFYPYFWGRKSNWVDVSQLTSSDPLFERFLTAGAARVVVPVPLQFRNAVYYLLQSKNPDLAQRVWQGGDRPTLDNDLYVSLVDELRTQTDDLQGAESDGDPWEYTLPTTLVWLQPGPDLPKFV